MKSTEQNLPVDGRHWVISLCAMVTKPSIGIFCALLLMVRQIHWLCCQGKKFKIKISNYIKSVQDISKSLFLVLFFFLQSPGDHDVTEKLTNEACMRDYLTFGPVL